MYRLLTFLMLVPCEIFSQGTFFVNDSEPLRPEVSIAIEQGTGTEIKSKVESEDISKQFALYLIQNGKRARIPVSANYKVADRKLILQPRKNLGAGLEFEIFYLSEADTLTQQYFTPGLFDDETKLEECKVETIYPLSTEVPQNTLFYHIRFNIPMQPDNLAFHKVSLYDAERNKVDKAWRNKSFWLDKNRLLVLMIHPGRVKRGIDMDIPYKVGESFEIKVEGEFIDYYGRKVSPEFSKSYVATAEDYEIPSLSRDKFVFPKAQTKDPLKLNFDGPMDHASIIDGVWIKDAEGAEIDGSFTALSDSAFEFVPSENWKSQRYELIFDKVVCDLASNRLNRPFEVENPDEVFKDKPIVWPFEVK